MEEGYSRTVWSLIAAMAALTIVSFILSDLTIAPFSNPSLLCVLAGLVIVDASLRRARPNPRVRELVETAAQMVLVLLFGVLLSYAAMSANFPYRDHELYTLDQALGFDRRAYLNFFEHHRWLERITELAYLSLLPQFACVPMVLQSAGRRPQAQRLLLATGIALILTSAISIFVPAVGAYVYIDITPGAFAKLANTIYTPVPTLESLRAGTFDVIELNNLEGLISFPSFHTVGALLFIWAIWPLRTLRWPAIALNAALISATPIFGAHYFVDLIGGAAVAFTSIMVSRWLCGRGTRCQPETAELHSRSGRDRPSIQNAE